MIYRKHFKPDLTPLLTFSRATFKNYQEGLLIKILLLFSSVENEVVENFLYHIIDTNKQNSAIK